jgi:enoyl-CoA hydratase/carnithine racemase
MLPRLVGLSHAADLLLTARLIDAGEAHRIGLVNRLMPTDSFHEFAARLAADVSPSSTRIIKAQLVEAQTQTLDQAFATAEREMLASLTCDDFREGVAHFLEKRAPRFTGR